MKLALCQIPALLVLVTACTSLHQAPPENDRVGWKWEKVQVNGREWLIPKPPATSFESKASYDVQAKIDGILDTSGAKYAESAYQKINELSTSSMDKAVAQYYLIMRAANGLIDPEYAERFYAAHHEAVEQAAGQAEPASDTEPNDQQAQATAITTNASLKGTVGHGQDTEDWYCLSAERTGTVTVTIENLSGGRKISDGFALNRLVVVTPTGAQIKAHSAIIPPPKSDSVRFGIALGQVFYIRVQPHEARGVLHTPTYRLSTVMQ